MQHVTPRNSFLIGSQDPGKTTITLLDDGTGLLNLFFKESAEEEGIQAALCGDTPKNLM